MLIYNTLSRKKEEFIPADPAKVNIYVCGPTVYDYFHIGNARSFIMADMIRKYLEYKSYTVRFVMNLTDIDDRIIKKANNAKKPAKNISEFFSNAFFEDLAKLKIKKADVYPKATENVEEIIAHIKQLVDAGFAYNVGGDVFYDVKKFADYGKLSGKNIDELESGARVEIDERKHNPLDFALWKKAKEGEPYWESPWGAGRPGWHIECSAMSMKFLGLPIDIHAGGNDLVFPHHENEIAQSEAVSGKEFVKYWMHFGFLNIQNEKMSKSLGNFFTAREILSRYSAETIRLFLCQTHYAGPLNFSEDLLVASNKGQEKILNLAQRIEDGIKLNGEGVFPDFDFHHYYSDFEAAMDDDFNSPQAIAVIFDFIRDFNRSVSENANISNQFYIKGKEFLSKTAQDVLGIVDFSNLANENKEVLVDELIDLLIKLRTKAKSEKNYRLSDEIRDELKNIGVILQDQKDKTSYKIVRAENQAG